MFVFQGNAGSLRILCRILPFILSEELEESVVGEAIAKLEDVSQLITAPKLTFAEIDFLHFSVIEYLDIRLGMVEDIGAPTLKPKERV